MKRILFPLLTLLLFTAACHSHAPGESHDGHDHGTEAAAGEDAHDHAEGEETEAVLTAEQVAAVGMEYGILEDKQLTATMRANGQIKVPNNDRANATSLWGGVVKSIPIEVGMQVRKGQVVATISNPEFLRLQEEYLTLESRIRFAGQELQRQKDLNAGNAGALKNQQSADAELRTLRTRQASLKQQLTLMGISPAGLNNGNLQSTLSVRSPVSGAISEVMAKIGSYVDVSSPVAEIVDMDKLHLDLNVFEKDLPNLKLGQIIHFTLVNNGSREYDARIHTIGSAFESDSRTIPVHATVQGSKEGLIDGMNITALVSLNEATTPAVPESAIISAGGMDYIFMVETPPADRKKGPVTFRRVQVVRGASGLGYTAITPVTALPAEATLVTKGAFFLQAKLTNTGEHEH